MEKRSNKKFRIYNQINLIDPKENIVFSRFFLKIDNNKLKIIDEIHFDKNQKIIKKLNYFDSELGTHKLFFLYGIF